MRILVTGGAGFVGSHLVDRLVVEDAGDVVVLDNFHRGRLDNLASSRDQVEVVTGDVRDGALLSELMSGVDLVYHLAAQSNVLGAVRDPDYCFRTNVVGTYEVLKAASQAGVQRVVFSSSREVYGETASVPVPESSPLAPINAYGASKAAGEMCSHQFAASGLEIVILRLANVYGPRDRDRVIPLFAKQALSGQTLTVFGSDKVVDFLWIHDLIDVLRRCARCPSPNGPVNLGSGRGTNLIDLAERVRLLVGGESQVVVKENRRSEVSHYIADVSLAQQVLGLRCPDDPIGHLQRVIDAIRHENAGPVVAA